MSILRTIASAFSTVPFPSVRKAKPVKVVTHSLNINFVGGLDVDEINEIYEAFTVIDIDPALDRGELADLVWLKLLNECAGRKNRRSRRQFHLSIPLETVNVQLTKRKSSYITRVGESWFLKHPNRGWYWSYTVK